MSGDRDSWRKIVEELAQSYTSVLAKIKLAIGANKFLKYWLEVCNFKLPLMIWGAEGWILVNPYFGTNIMYIKERLKIRSYTFDSILCA